MRKTTLINYVTNEGPDWGTNQPATMRSLIKVFVNRLQNHWIASEPDFNNQILFLRKLVLVFAGLPCQIKVSSPFGPFNLYHSLG